MPFHQPHVKDLTPFQTDFLGSSINPDTSISPLSFGVSIGNICQSAVFLDFRSRVTLDDHPFFPSDRVRVGLDDLAVCCEGLRGDSFGMDWDEGWLERVSEGVNRVRRFGHQAGSGCRS